MANLARKPTEKQYYKIYSLDENQSSVKNP